MQYLSLYHGLLFADGFSAERYRCYDDTHGYAAIIVTTYTEYVASFDASPWTNFANEPLAGQLCFTFSEVAVSLLTDIAKILPLYYFSTRAMKLAKFYADDYLTQQQQHWHDAELYHLRCTDCPWKDACRMGRNGLRLDYYALKPNYCDGWQGALGSSKHHQITSTWIVVLVRDWETTQLEQKSLVRPLQKLVRGEQILWSGQSGLQDVDLIVWPRAASSAEIFWSEKQPTGAALNVTGALPLLICT
ncbi:uncharacterized protein F5147DRAFT_821580 [Suillus discolor]|uniref:Beta-N-acetylhexosaminidase n=1 Tax=Suillus discolor TaxID=1912936 RepID=A0A9P7JNH2_9AGAM|nr:uncharacterized protein F5147DRAFT_821580 [Suillus discolor]KAG2092800.1 hypothetical protein F5147DRAFT_821580 [Suillus discolor]